MSAVKAPAMEARGLAWRLCSGLYLFWSLIRWPVALFAVFIAVTLGASPMGIDLGTRVQLVIGGASVGGLLIYANVDWDRRVGAASRYWDAMPEPPRRSLRDHLLGRGAGSGPQGDWYGVDFMFITRRTLQQDPDWAALRTAVLKSTQAARGQFVVLLVLLFLIGTMLSFAGVAEFPKLRAVAVSLSRFLSKPCGSCWC